MDAVQSSLVESARSLHSCRPDFPELRARASRFGRRFFKILRRTRRSQRFTMNGPLTTTASPRRVPSNIENVHSLLKHLIDQGQPSLATIVPPAATPHVRRRESGPATESADDVFLHALLLTSSAGCTLKYSRTSNCIRSISARKPETDPW